MAIVPNGKLLCGLVKIIIFGIGSPCASATLQPASVSFPRDLDAKLIRKAPPDPQSTVVPALAPDLIPSVRPDLTPDLLPELIL